MASIWDTLFPKQDYRTAAPSGGYADLYANGLLGNRTDTPTSVGAMETGKDFIPVLSDVLAFGEAGHALSEGDRKTAAILAAGGLLGTIPGLGPTLARPVMAAGRKAADVAGRIEVDPNAVGSLLGNVRVKPKGDVQDEIALFHGSPYDFRDFDLGQVGKGEGAQDLGRGFSLTDEEIVAHSYMNPASRWGDLGAMERYRQAGPGRTYEVAVRASPDQILDWKRPWKDQVPEGTPLYEKIQESMVKSYADDSEMQKLFQQANLSSAWRDDFGMEDAAIKSGFVGNKRKNFSGDTEFTIFDPSRMEMRKVFDNEGRQLPLSPPSPAELPEPRNEAEAMAKQVLEMRAAGDAGNVTEDMMALADDTYMYKNTPIDMSEASRLSRSEDFNPDYFHGSNADIAGFDRSSRGTFLSSSPDVADSYVSRDGGQIYPVSVRGGSDFPRVEASGSNFNRIPEAGLPEEFEYMKYDNNGRPFNTDFIVSQSSQEGSPGVLFSNIVDRGPNVKTYLGETSDEAKARAARASMPSDVTNVKEPQKIRSRFARFDPEFKHLKNLSAGVGVAPIGLLALREEQKRANEEQYKRGLLQ
jgi:hypothetical protein